MKVFEKFVFKPSRTSCLCSCLVSQNPSSAACQTWVLLTAWSMQSPVVQDLCQCDAWTLTFTPWELSGERRIDTSFDDGRHQRCNTVCPGSRPFQLLKLSQHNEVSSPESFIMASSSLIKGVSIWPLLPWVLPNKTQLWLLLKQEKCLIPLYWALHSGRALNWKGTWRDSKLLFLYGACIPHVADGGNFETWERKKASSRDLMSLRLYTKPWLLPFCQSKQIFVTTPGGRGHLSCMDKPCSTACLLDEEFRTSRPPFSPSSP